MAAETEVMRGLLHELLDGVRRTGSYPGVREFRGSHEAEQGMVDEMVSQNLIEMQMERYVLTLAGLYACGSVVASAEIEAAANLLPSLKDAYRRSPDAEVTSDELARDLGWGDAEVRRALSVLRSLPVWRTAVRDGTTGLVSGGQLSERILATSASAVTLPATVEDEPETADLPTSPLTRVEIDGYRPFRRFVAEPGELTVIIGANATGKSSLFDFLRFVSRAAQDFLPPEIDERSVGKRLFHASGDCERISFGLTLDLGHRLPLRYEAEILGPVGSPKVSRERLATTRPLRSSETDPFVFLDFAGGRGLVRDQRERPIVRPEWTLKPNELALRRVLDPTLVTLSRVRGLIANWRFYSGFDVSSGAGVRRPIATEPAPTLHEDGGNLSAVLLWLNREHQSVWAELESHVRSGIPGFKSLNVKPRGGPGSVIGVWREDGVDAELTLADLSDGTLRFLCWVALCLSPVLPPLLCIDEPECGLHPRMFPVLAGLFRCASARAQVLLATHSSDLLSRFSLDEIAVMRKEGGAAHFVRPSSSQALREAMEGAGGEPLP